MADWTMNGQNGILTCSALKRTYRDILINGAQNWTTSSEDIKQYEKHSAGAKETAEPLETEDKTHETDTCAMSDKNVLFVYLKGTKEILAGRIGARKGHFMPASLLDSQIATLEEPGDDEPHITVDVTLSIEEMSSQICHYLKETLKIDASHIV